MKSILCISLFLSASLLAGVAVADDQTTITTRAGTLSITGAMGDVSLFLDRKKTDHRNRFIGDVI